MLQAKCFPALLYGLDACPVIVGPILNNQRNTVYAYKSQNKLFENIQIQQYGR